MYTITFPLELLSETTKISVRISDISANIVTQELQITEQNYYPSRQADACVWIVTVITYFTLSTVTIVIYCPLKLLTSHVLTLHVEHKSPVSS